jgi:hypothetical protein
MTWRSWIVPATAAAPSGGVPRTAVPSAQEDLPVYDLRASTSDEMMRVDEQEVAA